MVASSVDRLFGSTSQAPQIQRLSRSARQPRALTRTSFATPGTTGDHHGAYIVQRRRFELSQSKARPRRPLASYPSGSPSDSHSLPSTPSKPFSPHPSQRHSTQLNSLEVSSPLCGRYPDVTDTVQYATVTPLEFWKFRSAIARFHVAYDVNDKV